MDELLDLTFVTDQIPVGIWVGRVPDGRLLYVNRAFQDIMGQPAAGDADIEQAPGVYGIFDVNGRPYPPDRLPFALALASGHNEVADDLVIHRGDGSRVNVRAYAQPMKDASGNVTAISVSFLDVSQEKQAMAARADAAAHLEIVANNAPLAIWSTDAQGIVTMSEGAGLKGLGVAPGQLVGVSVFGLYPDHPEISASIRRALGGSPQYYSSDVGEVVFETWLSPVRNKGGSVVGIAGVSQDVTETRRLQGMAIQHDRMLALGTVAASVAHEINNPLTYLLGQVEMVVSELGVLRADVTSNETAVGVAQIDSLLERLDPVLHGAQRIASITRDLRSFSRPDDKVRSVVDLREVARRVVQLVGKEVQAHARLTLDLQEDTTAYVNESRLVQVLLNLVLNALHAVKGRGEVTEHEILISTRQSDGFAVIDVSDTGLGIPFENRGRVFEPFFSTKAVGEGTGLGLFVCRNILRECGGDIIWIQEEGWSTRFRVTVPSKAGADVEAGTLAGADVEKGRGGMDKRIVVIDDEPMVADVLALKLRRHGYIVTVYNDPELALDELSKEAEPIDLVLCDLMMRGLTGMDLSDALAARKPSVADKMVFMTGGAFTPKARKFIESRPGASIDKPFDVLEEVRRRLDS